MSTLLKAARAVAFSASMASVRLSFPAAAASGCAQPDEHSAMQVRILQSDLMVAALTCDARESYNSFVRKFEPVLIVHGKTLRGYFQRTHGSGGRAELNKYVTTLANEASTRRLAGAGNYCDSARALFSHVLHLKSAELARFSAARGVISKNSAPACKLQSASAAAKAGAAR